MACASSLLSEEHFLCSICLEVFTDPITTPCGHNYCNTCITHYWDTSDVCQCPLCNETFDKIPMFSVNKVLSEMADQFRKTWKQTNNSYANQEPAEPDDVSCDVCTETKLKALKSCLVCLASYCDTHLELHHRVTRFKRHKLIDPVKNLVDIICKKHDRPLELFCKTDHMCICQFCTESDHKLHQIISLKEAYEGKKAELEKTEAGVQQMIQVRQLKIQEVKHSVQLSKKDADKGIADSVQIFTALISCVEQSQAEVFHVIEEKQKTTEKLADGFNNELEQENTELKKRSSELKQPVAAQIQTPSTENQKQTVGSLLKTPLRKGDKWYLIDSRWFRQWKKYVGFDSWDMYNVGDHNVYPGPIDNSGLFSDHETQVLKEHLIDELDYVLVPTEAWNMLVSWYGCREGQKAIVRKVIESGLSVKHCKVEVYLLELNLCENDNMDNVVTRKFSRTDTIDAIEKEMRSLFEIPSEKETRLWNKYMSNTYELNKPDSTVQDAGLYLGQVLVIERKNKDDMAQTSPISSKPNSRSKRP